MARRLSGEGQKISLTVKDLRTKKGTRTSSGSEVIAKGKKGSVHLTEPCDVALRQGLQDALGCERLRLAGMSGRAGLETWKQTLRTRAEATNSTFQDGSEKYLLEKK